MRWFFLALSCLALCASTLAQAPLDYHNYCRTNFRFADEHVFPENWKILLDSHDYQNLIEQANPVWARREFDGDGGQWVQRGGICQYDLRACNFALGQQDNWVFTQYISYLEARELIFDITFRFSQCTGNPACTNDFANIYRYNVEGMQTSSSQTNKNNYREKIGTLQQVGTTDNKIVWRFNRTSDANINGFYLGFEDLGTCGQIRRVLIYHKNAPGYRDDSKLVTCHDTALPPTGSTGFTTTQCSCDANAFNVSSLKRSCDQAGVCTGQPECACNPGYELNANGACTVCPPGTFKATVSNTEKCTPCPLNSNSVFEASEVCTCMCGTVRPNGKPGTDCRSPPSSPLVAIDNPPVVESNSVTIHWHPANEDGGSPETLYYNVYTYDTSEKEFTKVNDKEINQESSSNLFKYTFDVENLSKPISVVVTSATSATGDEAIIKDLSEVQNRFILLYIYDKPDDMINNGDDTKPVVVIAPIQVEIDNNSNDKDNVVPDITITIDEGVGTVPQVQSSPLHFELGSQIYTNESTVSLSEIREGDEGALLCKTDNLACCRSSFEGEFYYPDKSLVPVRAAGASVYRNRGEGFIRLNYLGSGNVQLGLYECKIPDSNGDLQSIFININ